MKKIFIAGPIFSEGERDYNLRIDSICKEIGCKTFMAQRDVGIVANNTLEEAFNSDLNNLKNSDIIVANLDGVDVDSGTAWELGYASSLNKPIIGIRSDVRMYRKFMPLNLMIFKSCIELTTLENLKKTLLKLQKNGRI